MGRRREYGRRVVGESGGERGGQGDAASAERKLQAACRTRDLPGKGQVCGKRIREARAVNGSEDSGAH